MARLLGSVAGLVSPERRLFLVIGEGCDAGDYVPDFGQDRLCYADGGAMYVVSATQWHDAAVALEAWDGHPPADPSAERSETTEMELPRGAVRGWALLAPAVTPVLRVGPAGRYAVRVDVSGRSEVLRRVQDPNDRPAGIERFAVRLWPARRSASGVPAPPHG
jgi:hypothetical protein